MTATDVRLARTGGPLLLSNALMIVNPVVARLFLGDADYSLWALLTTIALSGFVFDLGATPFLQSSGYGVFPDRAFYRRAVVLQGAGVFAVTSVALAAVALLAGSAVLSSRSPGGLALLVLVTGISTATRGAFTVLLARLQVAELFRLRTVAAVAQAVAQVGLVVGGLVAGLGVWTLPLSIGISGLGALLLTHTALSLNPPSLPPAAPSAALSTFVAARTAGALVTILAGQVDRWVLAAVSTPAFLADYDIAVRFGAIPCAVVATIYSGMVSEIASLRTASDRRHLVRRTTGHAAFIVAALSVVVILGVLILQTLGLLDVTRTLMAILGLALVWMGLNALTSPATMAFTGSGRPQGELWYAAPLAGLSVLGWLLASIAGSEGGVVAATFAANVLCSTAFVGYSLRRARFGRANGPQNHGHSRT